MPIVRTRTDCAPTTSDQSDTQARRTAPDFACGRIAIRRGDAESLGTQPMRMRKTTYLHLPPVLCYERTFGRWDRIRETTSVDDVRFDGMTRVLGALLDRRKTARAAAGGALTSLGLAAGHDVDAKKKKKKCKGGKKKCGKKCCPVGQFCRNGKCSTCPPPRFLCPNGDCVETLCGGECCAVAQACIGNQCVACPDVADRCAGTPPQCNNGNGFCGTSVEGGNFCTAASVECLLVDCTTDEECVDHFDAPAICVNCASCGGGACVQIFSE
jgi:hypothetical protein